MTTSFDSNLFSQTDLDSGALTLLGVVVHSFREPGEYRGVVRRGTEPEAAFYISADSHSAVAQVNIDLATLAQSAGDSSGCGCGGEPNRFVVHPKGHAVFHVSGGAGGYNVHVRKAEEDRKTAIFDSRELGEGDVFSAALLRPGTYAVSNQVTMAKAQAVVSYPVAGKTAYRPPAPVVVECDGRDIKPHHIELQPGQGLNFHLKAKSRIKIELVEPDDGPGRQRQPAKRGWIKPRLPRE